MKQKFVVFKRLGGSCLGVLTLGVLIFAAAILLRELPVYADKKTPRRVNGLPNHRYPRIGSFQWPGAVPDWYARFDLLDTGTSGFEQGANFARAIKAINPNVIILPSRDWNAGPGGYDGTEVPREWIARHSDGSFVNLYFETDYYMDMTDFCPRATSGRWAGKRYNEIVADWHLSFVDLSVIDGVATDGVWNFPYSAQGDIDLDRNGVNDFKEHGENWISDQITKGLNKILADLRKAMGPDKAILVNSGGMHTWGWEYTNGLLKEHSAIFYSLGDVNYNMDTYHEFMAKAPQPHVTLIDGETGHGVPGHEPVPRNNFRHMRFWLGFTLMGDGYLSFSVNEEHMYTVWYDEFEIDLGYPTISAQKIREGADGAGGMWVRFFDEGAVIFNATGVPQQVSDGDLARIPGYAGPYYHFRGGQDPKVNNGARFTSEIVGSEITRLSGGTEAVTGESVILLKSPKEIVSDIIVDNWHHGTSPASSEAELKGRWINLPHSGDQSGGGHYTLRNRYFADYFDPGNLYGYAMANKGDGSDYAVYRPTIGLAGNYEIFEWHGYLGNGPGDVREATNVKYKIKYSGGEKTVVVDQSQNYGRWNSLGTYYFSTGQNGQVSYDNNTDGPIMADAIKFVFRGSDPNRDRTPPQPPKGVRVTQ
jgi:hypothetical protein